MDYVGPVFRPPSEAESLLLPVTVGCSHNRCTFCGMYRTKRFGTVDPDIIRGHLDQAAAMKGAFRRVFLLDGDALAAPDDFLIEVLGLIQERLPWVERVGAYGDARSILAKGEAGMKRLRTLGLGMVYHGIESGNDEVLRRVGKPVSRDEMAAVGRIMKAASVRYSVMALLGLGGVELSDNHARGTAEALSLLDPDYIGLLTLMLVPSTALHRDEQQGRFKLPDRFGMLAELRTVLAEARVTAARFSANHASNFLPITGDLPRDRDSLLALVDDVLAARDDSRLRPEWHRGL
jgi:radical SAM superfamily enzyme YgiQ (UPF0313 family)